MTYQTRLLIVGAGGHGRSVAEAAQLSGCFTVVGFLDDALPLGTVVLGVAVLGAINSMTLHLATCDQVIVAIGNNMVRKNLSLRLIEAGGRLATVIHPNAFVSPSATVGVGGAVLSCATVGTEACLGMGVIVNCGAVVDHHARVEDYGHLGVNACMAGGSVLGMGALLQAGSALGYGVSVQPETVVLPSVGVTVNI